MYLRTFTCIHLSCPPVSKLKIFTTRKDYVIRKNAIFLKTWFQEEGKNRFAKD